MLQHSIIINRGKLYNCNLEQLIIEGIRGLSQRSLTSFTL